ncbi:MAG: APC family permease, partial [Pseudomonadota bacterium]|nr:APC family permease [Pseudomonadota bacterium]
PLAMFVLVGIWFIEPGHFQFQPMPNANTLALAVMVLIFAFSGFEVATINAGEVQNPEKAFPYALFFTVALVLVFYLAIQIVAIGTLPSLATSSRPLADAATMFVGPIGAAVIVVGAIISTSGTLNAGLLGGSRLPYAMARENQVPSFFGQTHTKYHTPTSSLMITAVACWLACLTFNFVEALTINSVIRLITYAIVCAALPVLRRRPDTRHPNYVVRMGPWVSGSALLLCAWLLSRVSLAEVLQVSGAIVLGGILYGLSAIRR